jgi:WhiB family redox-sensing transcriptional regulator
MKRQLPCLIRDPDLWFPVGNSGPAVLQAEEAKAWCRTCPIVEACLQRALDSGEGGVWGATTEDERRGMLRRGERSMDSAEARRVMDRSLASA